MAESLTDIAKKLNVAASTVSRAISDPEKVAPKTRKKILEYIEKVGYRPNLAARNLRMQRANTVGIVVNDLCDSLISSAANVMQNVASARGYFPVVLSTDDSSKKEAEIIESLLTHNICGLVIIPSSTTHEHFEKLRNIPVVELDRCTDCLINDEFRMDDRAAMQLSVNHLKSLGCKHIAGLFGNIERVSSFNSRYLSMPRSNSLLKTSSFFLKEVSAPKLQAAARYLTNCIIKSQGLGNAPRAYIDDSAANLHLTLAKETVAASNAIDDSANAKKCLAKSPSKSHDKSLAKTSSKALKIVKGSKLKPSNKAEESLEESKVYPAEPLSKDALTSADFESASLDQDGFTAPLLEGMSEDSLVNTSESFGMKGTAYAPLHSSIASDRSVGSPASDSMCAKSLFLASKLNEELLDNSSELIISYEVVAPAEKAAKKATEKAVKTTKNSTRASKSGSSNSSSAKSLSSAAVKDSIHNYECIDGLIAANHTIAAGMVQAFRDNGILPNDKIKIVVFDDPDWLDVLPYKIASISHPLSIAAEQAMHRLLDRIENKSSNNAEVHLIRPELLHAD